MQGTIKTINHQKGFGFIRTPSGQDYFFHRSVVHGQAFELIEERQPVEFEPGEGREGKGPRAERVEFLR